MTQKDKELLLKDLCIRLPYGVKIHINSCIEEQNQMQLFDVNIEAETIGVRNEKWAFRAIPIIDDEDETKVIKPYLRPMSSMTEEEFKMVCSMNALTDTELRDRINFPNMFVKSYTIETFDLFNSHHFDYRGLIPMGLTLEAPEGMYKSE